MGKSRNQEHAVQKVTVKKDRIERERIRRIVSDSWDERK
jgi:hypothetical protein